MERRPKSPYQWLDELQRLKLEALKGSKGKVTIQDIVERGQGGFAQPSSPRSVEACLRLGINPSELLYVPPQHFHRQAEDPVMSQMMYERCERLRQERLQALVAERKAIMEGEEGTHGRRPGQPPQGKAKSGSIVGSAEAGWTSAMVEKEARRLEVLRRRQERELAQMVSFELARKQLQERAEAKVRDMEARAEAQRQAKVRHDREWREHQKELQLREKEDEEARQREVKRQEAERYRMEQLAAKEEEEEEQRRRQAAYQREQEQIARLEAARSETEKILAAQQAEVDRKKADMARRDAEREAVKAKMAAERAAANAEARRRAEERITAAIDSNRAIMAQKRAEFDARQRIMEQRRKAGEAERLAEEAERRAREQAKEEQRKGAYADAQAKLAGRIGNIQQRAADKEARLEALRSEADKHNQHRRLARQLHLQDKVEKVEANRRKDTYRREQLLAKIEDDTVKAHEVLRQRQMLQDARKAANMTASFQRQRLVEAIERLQTTKNWSAVAGPDGHVDINVLMARVTATGGK